MTDATLRERAHGPGPHAWARLTWTEAKLVARDTAGLVVPLGLPMLILVMNALGADREPVEAFGGLPVLDAYIVPLTLVMVVAVVGVVNMPSFLATYRKTGVLRRLGVTPAHPAMVLVAQVLVSLGQAVVGVALALGLATLAFGVSMPGSTPWALAALALTAAAMYALGMLVAAVSPTTNAAIAIGLMLFFGQLALGGGFGPRENLPVALAAIGEHLPYGAGLEALSAAWIGTAPQAAHLGVLAATAVLVGALAAKLFRWE